MYKNGPKRSKPVKAGQQRSTMDNNGQYGQNGQKRVKTVKNVKKNCPKWSKMDKK